MKKIIVAAFAGLVALGPDVARADGFGPAQPSRAEQNQPQGGIGIFVATDTQPYRIAKVLEGGPADQAGLAAGDVLVAVDDVSVDQEPAALSRIAGTVGTSVKLTIERNGRRTTINVRRATVSPARPAPPPAAAQPQPGPHWGGPLPAQPPVNPRPAPAAGGGIIPQGQRQVGNVQLPAFLKAGTRITYRTGASTLEGVRLIPDSKGYIQDNQGRRYTKGSNNAIGSVGYTQITIQQADADVVAADNRYFGISDVEAGVASPSGISFAEIGDATQMGETWIHPARLAQMREGRDGGTVVERVPYQVGDRVLNAIVVRSSGGHYKVNVYDLESGLMLFGATNDADPAVTIVDPQGNARTENGAVNQTTYTLIAVRETNVPWASEPAPQWIGRVHRLDYRGGYTMVMNDAGNLGPLPAQPATATVTLDKTVGGCVVTTTVRTAEIGIPVPQREPYHRLHGPAMFQGLWASPKALARLQPNQVLDEDPVTRFRTTFVGVQQNVAVIVEQGPLHRLDCGYDMNTGLLVYMQITDAAPNILHKTVIGSSVTTLQLAGQQ